MPFNLIPQDEIIEKIRIFENSKVIFYLEVLLRWRFQSEGQVLPSYS